MKCTTHFRSHTGRFGAPPHPRLALRTMSRSGVCQTGRQGQLRRPGLSRHFAATKRYSKDPAGQPLTVNIDRTMRRPLISRTIGSRYAPGSHQQKTIPPIQLFTSMFRLRCRRIATVRHRPRRGIRPKRRALADTPRDRFASNRPMFGSPRRGSPQPHPCPIAESLKYPLPQRNSSATPDSTEVAVLANQNEIHRIYAN